MDIGNVETRPHYFGKAMQNEPNDQEKHGQKQKDMANNAFLICHEKRVQGLNTKR